MGGVGLTSVSCLVTVSAPSTRDPRHTKNTGNTRSRIVMERVSQQRVCVITPVEIAGSSAGTQQRKSVCQ